MSTKKQKENQDFCKLLSTLDPQSLNFSMISDFLTCIFFELVHISCTLALPPLFMDKHAHIMS